MSWKWYFYIFFLKSYQKNMFRMRFIISRSNVFKPIILSKNSFCCRSTSIPWKASPRRAERTSTLSPKVRHVNFRESIYFNFQPKFHRFSPIYHRSCKHFRCNFYDFCQMTQDLYILINYFCSWSVASRLVYFNQINLKFQSDLFLRESSILKLFWYESAHRSAFLAFS